MYLHSPLKLLGNSGRGMNKYLVRMETAGRVANGVYLVAPDAEKNRNFGIEIQRQLITVQYNYGDVIILNESRRKNVIPSGQPLFHIQLVTSEENQLEKSNWITTNGQFTDI